jgi:uncharacterized protein YceK
MRRTLGALTATALLAGCGSGGSATDDGPDLGDKYAAQVMCEKFVKQQLKAPATAEFDSGPGVQSGKAWVVEGTVDSENSFGAMLRNDFRCKVKYLGNDEWRLQNLAGLDN